MNQLGSLTHNTIKRVETKMPFSRVGGTPSAMFIDHELAVAVVLVSPATGSSSVNTSPVVSTSSASTSTSHYSQHTSPPSPVFIALVFDLRTGTFLLKQDVAKYEGDSWVVDDTGIFRERSGAIVQRLNVIGSALPMRTSVADASSRVLGRSTTMGRADSATGKTLPTMPAYGLYSPTSPARRRQGRISVDHMGGASELSSPIQQDRNEW